MIRNLLTTTLVLLVLFGGFVFGLDLIHMRPDEHLVYIHTNNSLSHTVWYQARRDVQAPLWHSFFWAWRHLTGESEFAGRYQGVLWSTLTLSIVYILVRYWFGKPLYGWFAMLTLGTNALFFTYAFEIRPYPVVLLAATLCMWMFWRWLQTPTRKRAVFYGLSLALLAYVHYFLAFLVAAQWIYFALQSPSRRQWVHLGGAILLAALVWSPWAYTFIYQVNLLRQIDGGSFGIASTTQDTSLDGIMRLVRRATNALPLLWGMLLLAGVWLVRRREYALLLLWGLGVPVIALTVNTVANVYDQRYIVYLSLGVSLAAAVTLAALPGRAMRWVVLIAFVGVNVWFLPRQLPDRIPYRHILQRMNANAQPGDVLLFDQANQTDGFVRWQIDQYLSPALLENQVQTIGEAAEHRRVWYVSGDVTQPDIRARFRQLEATHPLVMVTGRCQYGCFIAQLLEGAPSQSPVVVFQSSQFDDELPFYGVDVLDVTNSVVQLRLWWLLDKPLTLDYSVSVRLVDEAGNIVVAQDNPPIDGTGNSQRTSQIEPDQIVVDWRVLNLPPDISPGTYQLQLVAYDSVGGSILSAGGQDHLQAKTIIIP